MPQLLQVDTLLLLACFGMALGISASLTPLVGRVASHFGAVAKPRQDRWHQKPTPLLGGVAIYAATSIVVALFVPHDLRLAGLMAGGTLLFVTGFVDDLRHLRPHTKLIIQMLAGCILVASGTRIELTTLAVLSIPLTIFWVAAITNAFNLIDNMDGLSAGTAMIASLFLFGFSASTGNVGLALLGLAVAGSSLGFLIYNFNPARIFMGDSGSMFLGFMLSGLALMGTRDMTSDIIFVLLVPAAIMGLPIFDTTLVTIVRTLEGRPVSQGGRDHLSHRLVALGLSERQAVLLLYAFAASFGSLGLIARALGVWTSMAVAGMLVAAAVVFGAYLAQVRIYSPADFAQAERTQRLANRPIVNGMIMHKREFGLAALDLVFIFVAYLGAYLLKHGTGLGAGFAVGLDVAWAPQFSETLPFLVVLKLVPLYAFRAYRGMWRYVGVADVLTLVKATALGSLIAGVAIPLIYTGGVIPRSVFFIDWMLFSILLVGSRLSFAALNDMFARVQRERVPGVLIIGAGDLGELVLRTIVRTRTASYRPIGFLDPDPGKRNRAIHGVPVLGGLDEIERLVFDRDVDQVVLAIPRGDILNTLAAREKCRLLGLATLDAGEFVEMHFAGEPRVDVPAVGEAVSSLRNPVS